MNSMTIKILIADDHEIVRKGLSLMLRQEPGFEVVGEARDGAEAVRLAESLAPDVALLDLMMPVMDGRAAAIEIKRSRPAIRVMILSGVEPGELVFETIEAGVDGYAIKDISPAELSRAIRTVAEGKRYIHAAVTQALLERAAPRPARPQIKFSPRELDVLRLMATAATYKEIGGQLFISEETVRSHVKSILAKIDQPNRTQTVVAAVKMGLIKLD